ncbi:helix-turn-helix domain-containing protein [Amycolatopsis sp. NBC_01488]|uniref:helix-turn-helix domain-containing protein n=1 Tax=Amycolatopsis sp. NBC_01488 TaxID=2903563 RepID=UPI002E2B2C31|nr:helix-turn-helix transcriptional regulator [Amycolatopsis sp. NBC_01488]
MPLSRPGPPGELDPSGVTTLTQLAALLRQCRVRAGNPSLRDIERLGEKRGQVLPRSTVAGVLAGRRGPRRDLFLALLTAFGIPEDDRAAWTNAWEKAVAGEPDADGEPAPDFWRFPPGEPVMITCGRIPESMVSNFSATDPRDPDHVDLLTYADLDALVHLYGHIRALNPLHDVKFATTSDLQPADYSSHLVMIGGSDFNLLTRDMFSTLRLPVKMSPRLPETDWLGLEVANGDGTQRFSPVLGDEYGARIPHEDVILFFRGVNPLDRRRTITICAGMYARGTLAAVRCLTDPVLGPRNQAYLRHQVGANLHFGFVARAFVIDRVVAPPDLTDPGHRLYEWMRPE